MCVHNRVFVSIALGLSHPSFGCFTFRKSHKFSTEDGREGGAAPADPECQVMAGSDLHSGVHRGAPRRRLHNPFPDAKSGGVSRSL